MYLDITIDKPINALLLREEMFATGVTEVLILDGHLTLNTTDPVAALNAYIAHDYTGSSQYEDDLSTMHAKIDELETQAALIDWENVTAEQAFNILHKVVEYLLLRATVIDE